MILYLLFDEKNDKIMVAIIISKSTCMIARIYQPKKSFCPYFEH